MSGMFENIILKQVGGKGPTIKEGTQAASLQIRANTKFEELSGMFKLSAEERKGHFLHPDDIEGMERASEAIVNRILEDKANEDIERLIGPGDSAYRTDKTTKINLKAGGLLRLKSGQFVSALNLVRMMNTILYQKTQNLMGKEGRLVNRTGRLAHSGVVTGLEQVGEDGVSFFFTYMLYPYEVFQRNPAMDPQGTRSPVALFSRAVEDAAKDLLTPRGMLDFDKVSGLFNPRGEF